MDDLPTSTSGRGGTRPGAGRKSKAAQNDALTIYNVARAKREAYKARLARIELIRADMDLKRRRGELVPATDVERTLVATLKIMVSLLETLPDILERDAGLSGAAVERVQALVDRTRDQLHAKLLALAGSPESLGV